MGFSGKIAEWNNTDAEIGYKDNINILLHEAALKHNERYVSFDRRGGMTYGQLDSYSNAVCNLLLENNNKTGDGNICILTEPRNERLCFITGILKAGMTYVPLDTKAPLNRNLQVIENVNCMYLFTDAQNYDRAAELSEKCGGKLIVKKLSVNELAEMDCRYAEVTPGLDRIAYIIHTSGSTGKPKGVKVSDKALNNFCWSITHEVTKITPEDRTCALQNVSFDYSLTDMFPFMLEGACIYFVPDDIKKDMADLNDFMVENGITQQAMTTALYHMFVEYDNPVLKKVFVAGEKMVKFFRRSYEIYNLYGPTEAAVIVTYEKVEEYSDNISIGVPIVNTKILIVREDGSLADINEKGEICIMGDNLAEGYINNEAETRKRFVPSVIDPDKLMYRTGDIGTWTEEGRILCFGRIDNQIKHRGYRIELDEINAAVASLDNITDCVVIYDDRHENKYISCFYCTSDGNNISDENINNALEEKLPEYMIPAKWIHMDSLPLNNNGKVNRAVLLEELEKQFSKSTGGASDDSLEGIVRNIWSELLGIENDFDANANFRSLGGHSILSFIMLKRLKERTGADVKFIEFMREDTLNKLCNLIRSENETEKKEFSAVLINAPEKRYEPFALNPIQQSYYYGRMSRRLGNAPTAVYLEFSETNIDISKLETALNRLVARHEMLRCVLCGDDEQRIIESPPYIKLSVEDMTGIVAVSSAKETADKVCHEMFGDFIDLKIFPAFRFRVIKFGETDYRIFTVIDCTFIDGASISVLIHDMYLLYNDLPLEPLKISFRDYLTAVKNETEGYREGMKYWLDRMDTLPEAPPVPVISENGTGERCNTIRKEAFVSADVWEKYKKIASDNNLSLFVIQVTIFSIVMARWSGKNKFTVNIPIFNRFLYDEQVMKLAGEFGSLIFLVVELEEDKGFIYNCKKISKQFERDMAHRIVNGIDIIRKYKEHGRELDMPVVFTSLTTPGGKDGIYNDETNLLRWKSHSSQVWMDSIVFDKDGGIEIAWDCYGGVFDNVMLDDMFAAYTDCYKKAASDDVFLNSRIDNAVNGRNYSSVMEINKTEYVYDYNPKLLHSGFMDNLKNNPDDPACITKDRCFTYSELYNAAAGAAQKLQKAGLKKGDYAAVIMSRGWKQIAAALAVLIAGGTYIPISPEWPEKRRAAVFRGAKICFAVTEYDIKENIECVDIDENSINIDCGFEPVTDISSDSAAYVIYTSGSTGDPKGVVISHKAAVNTLLTVNRRNKVTSEDRTIMLSELYFDLSVYDIFGMFFSGGSVYVPNAEEKNDPLCWKDILVNNKITIWNTVPAVMQILTDINEGSKIYGSSVRKVFLSGDWIPLNLPDKIRKTLGETELVSMGGATEASIWSNYYNVENVDKDWKSIPYGYPLDNQQMYVLDNNMKICPECVPGDIYIGGQGLAIEYLGDEELTSNKFIYCNRLGMRLYNTGDRGMYQNGNVIEFLGRNDDQVKLNGFRIELGEIEAFALKLDGVKAAVANFDKDKHKIDLYYVADKEITESEMKHHLRKGVPDYMLPVGYMMIDVIPTTSNGKIDRKKLSLIEDINIAASDDKIMSDTEKMLSDIFCEALGKENVSANDNFFLIGGDSLKAIKLISKINKEAGVHITLGDIFSNPVLKELALLIETSSVSEEKTLTPDKCENNVYRLTPVQQLMFIAGLTGKRTYFSVLTGYVYIHSYVDALIMKKAVELAVKRHSVLNYVFGIDDNGEPFQKPSSDEIDIDRIFVTEETDSFEKSIAAYSETKFDLTAGEVCRFVLLHMDGNENEYSLCAVIHHIASDEQSFMMIFAEIMSYYDRLIHDKDFFSKDSCDDGYSKYLTRKQEKLSNEASDYWESVIDDGSAFEKIPMTDETVIKGDEGVTARFDIEAETVSQFEKMCSENGVTLFSGLLSAFLLSIYTVSGKTDITMIVPFTDRIDFYGEQPFGMFIDDMVIFVKLDSCDMFKNVLDKTAQSFMSSYKAGSSAMYGCLRKHGLENEYFRNRLGFPFFDLINADRSEIKSETLDLSEFRYYINRNAAERDLSFLVERVNGMYEFNISYRFDTVSADSVERLKSSFRKILKNAVENKNFTISDLIE